LEKEEKNEINESINLIIVFSYYSILLLISLFCMFFIINNLIISVNKLGLLQDSLNY